MHRAIRQLRGITAGLAVVGLAALGIVVASPASAAELSAVQDIRITQPIHGVAVNDSVELNATWSVTDARAGDTFRLGLPGELKGVPTSFNLKDHESDIVGICEVTDTEIVCTLSSYVEDFMTVAGSLYFWSLAVEENVTGSVVFDTMNGPVEVPLPGGAIGPPLVTSFPETASKEGVMLTNGSNLIHWAILVPGAIILESNLDPYEIQDVHDSTLTREPGSIRVYYITEAQWAAGGQWGLNQFLDPSNYAVSNETQSGFTIALDRAAISADTVYVVQYETMPPADAKDGDVFYNTATGFGLDARVGTVFQGSGGDGEGSNDPRTISLTKLVEGPAPDEAQFVFSLECKDEDDVDLAGFPKELSIRADQISAVDGIPVGSTCLITETDGQGAEVSFDKPGPINVTRNSPEVIEVTATNTFEVPPTTPPVEPEPTDPGVETPGPSDPAPGQSATQTPTPLPILAHTGAQVTAVAVAALVLLLVGATIVAVRRRSNA